MTIEIICADILDWAASYDGPKFHALLSDPPYAWEFMGHKKADSNIALKPETWAALAEHLHPGAFVFAFAGPRTYHRLACAMEDAGLRLHSPILWLNAQGFPKAANLSKILDKAAGAEREVIATVKKTATANQCHEGWERPWAYNDDGTPKRVMDITMPATDLARTWAGHRYGLQAMKPCVEIIAIAQVPYSGKPVKSIVETGAGALNIEAGRIGIGSDRISGGITLRGSIWGEGKGERDERPTGGRWPPNVAFSHIPPTLRCPSCQAVYPMQPVIEACPNCGGGLEWVEGCKRVGAKRVKNADCKGIPSCTKSNGSTYGGGQHNTTYADPDGLETVDAYACVCGCEECGATWTVAPKVESIISGNHGEAPGGFNPTGRTLYGEGDPAHDVSGGYGKETIALHRRGPCPECGSRNTRWLCPTAALGEQSGESVSHNGGKSGKTAIWGDGFVREQCIRSAPNDTGTAARYYKQADWEAEQIECLPGCPIARLDSSAQSSGHGHFPKHPKSTRQVCYGEYAGIGQPEHEMLDNGDKSVSRFYHNADFSAETAERLAQEDPFRYCPKAAKRERSNGLGDFFWKRDKASPSGFVRVSEEEWESLPQQERARGNIHSTVKPISLLKWCASLLLPPQEYTPRRILVPFCGSGSEMIAAILVGFEEVIGIDLVKDYCDIARARIKFWTTGR